MSEYTQDRIIAFIDILGFKDLIKQQNIKEKIIGLLYNFKKEDREYGLREIPINGEVIRQPIPEISSYSDNIIISSILSSNTRHSIIVHLAIMCRYIAKFQISALENGILIRGAVSIGQMYYDSKESIILGEPLVEAIISEQNLAKYPRVILTDTLDKYCKEKNIFKYIPSLLCPDTDGFYFVNFFHFCKKEADVSKNINEIKKQIDINIKNAANIGIRSKWVWLANYYNASVN